MNVNCGFRFDAALRRLAAVLPLFLLFAGLLLPADSEAMPFFARRIGRDCTYCHTMIPKLNETGKIFRANGYRFAAEEEWQDAMDWKTLPASVEVEVEGMYDRLESGGVVTESSDMKVEEVEIAAGGPMGKSGRVSALGIAAFEETDAGADSVIKKAFVQVNDLIGPAGEGRLNIRAGKWDVGIPFLYANGAPIANRYLADSALNVITAGQRALEINGSVVREGEEKSLAHRYAFGLSREDVFDDDKLKGVYAAYSFTLNETYRLGGIYRTGREKLGAADTSYNKYGVAGEVEAGPVLLTAGFFISDRNGAPQRDNYMVEALYIPYKSIGFGARYDYLKERGSEGVKSQSFMVRYSILSNVYAQLEYRGLEDDGLVSGANESERRLRAFLFAIF